MSFPAHPPTHHSHPLQLRSGSSPPGRPLPPIPAPRSPSPRAHGSMSRGRVFPTAHEPLEQGPVLLTPGPQHRAPLRHTGRWPRVTLAKSSIVGALSKPESPRQAFSAAPHSCVCRVSSLLSWPRGSRGFLKQSRNPILTLMLGLEGVSTQDPAVCWVVAEAFASLPAADSAACPLPCGFAGPPRRANRGHRPPQQWLACSPTWSVEYEQLCHERSYQVCSCHP